MASSKHRSVSSRPSMFRAWSAPAILILAGAATQALATTTDATPAPAQRSARGLDRFFPTDEPTICAPVAARGIPMLIRDWVDQEPDPEPFRGMMLESMFDADGRPLIAACFAYEAPPPQEMIQIFEMSMGMADRFQPGTRWGGANGTPITLTWSFVPDGLNIPNGVGEPAAGSSLFAGMDAKFGSRAAWVSLFQQCFDRWGYLTGTSYTRITAPGVDWDDGANWSNSSNNGSSTRGQIRIGMKPIDGVNGVLAYNAFPNGGGDMVLDSAEAWGSQSGNNWRFLRNTIMHEHGHGLGFFHVCPINQTKLMEPFLATNFDGPRADDLRAASNFYGDAFGAIGSIAAAFDMGTLAPNTPYNPTAILTGGSVPNGSLGSIDSGTESDFFKFTIASPMLCNITVTPTGGSYADHPQDAECDTTTINTNANAMADLMFEIQNASGTVLLSRNLNAAGSAEAISGYLLSPAGDLYLRVRHNPSVAYNGVQLYVVNLITSTVPTVTADDALATDLIEVAWSAIPNATQYLVYRNTTNSRVGATQVATVVAPSANYTDDNVFGGITYYYWIEVVQSGSPAKALNVEGEPGSVASPDNDLCANAQTLSGSLPIAEPFANFGALTDGPSTCPTQISNDIWYRWTATSSGNLTVSTCSAMYDSSIAVYSGSACPPAGAPLACNDNSASCGPGAVASSTTLPVTAGSIYTIRVGGGTGTAQGAGSLNLSIEIPAVTGACCTGSDCSILTAPACATASGTYLGDNTVCAGGAGNPVTCCPANVNGTAGVTADDIFAYLDMWFAQNGNTGSGHSADFNHDNSVSADDIFAFLDAWFTGCE